MEGVCFMSGLHEVFDKEFKGKRFKIKEYSYGIYLLVIFIVLLEWDVLIDSRRK